jgi:CspA family cold shock protein
VTDPIRHRDDDLLDAHAQTAATDEDPRARGSIARLLSAKGFGFITGEDDVEYFFHRTQCTPGLFEQLIDGERVRFTVEQTIKGPRAVRVERAT